MVFIPRWEKYKDKKPTGAVELNRDLFNKEPLLFFSSGIGFSASTNEGTITERDGDAYAASTSDRILLPNSSPTNPYDATLLFSGTVFSNSTFNGIFSSNSDTNGGGVNLGVLNTLGYTTEFRRSGANTPDNRRTLITGANTLSLNKKFTAVSGFDSYSSAFCFIDGKSPSFTFSGGATIYEKGGGDSIVLGRFIGGVYYGIQTSASLVLVLDERISDELAYDLSVNPYQILKPRRQFFVFNASDLSANLTGSAVTATIGSVSVAVDNTLTGSQSAVTQGSLSEAISYALAGQLASAQTGMLQSAVAQALSGQALTSANQTLSSTVSAGLTGLTVNIDQDSLSEAIEIALSGQPVSALAGYVATLNNVTRTMTGQSLAAVQASLQQAIATELTGQALGILAGFVSTANNIVRSITGQALNTLQGDVTYDLATGLTGGVIQSNQGDFTLSVAHSLTGDVITVTSGFVELQGATTRTLIGALINASANSVSSAIEASLSGQALTLSQATIEASISSLLNGQTLVIEQGDQSVTIAKSLAGETVISGQGTLVFESLDQSATLSGLQIQTSAGIMLVDGVRDTRLVNVIAMANGGHVVVLDANTHLIVQDNSSKVIN